MWLLIDTQLNVAVNFRLSHSLKSLIYKLISRSLIYKHGNL